MYSAELVWTVAFRLAESLYISAGIPFPEYGVCEKLLRRILDDMSAMVLSMPMFCNHSP